MRIGALLLAIVGWVQTSLPPTALNRVAPGTLAPDFELPSADGGNFRLSSLRGKNVVLLFYRGHW
jgi:cytochrome oxidase Cu insertion factor (SCO1/SenC/PrrC family)